MRIKETTFEKMTGGSLLGDCILTVYYARAGRDDDPGADLFYPAEKAALVAEVIAEWKRRVGSDLPDDVFPFKDDTVLHCWVRTRKANNSRKAARATELGVQCGAPVLAGFCSGEGNAHDR